MTAMPLTNEQRVSNAMLAWDAGSRRRRRGSLVDGMADALLAAGGILTANATLPLELGLPAGRPGIALGAGLLGAGLAWITRRRPRRSEPLQAPAIEARAAIPLEAWRAA